MPMYECRCTNTDCPACGKIEEFYARHMADPNPSCGKCRQPTERMASRFFASWTGSLDRFNEPGHEGQMMIPGGHAAYRVRSSRNPDGSPELVRITNRQEQIEYCRAEGLEDPANLNPDLQVGKDGISACFYGTKGAWGQPFTNPFEPAPASLVDWDAEGKL